MRFGNDSSVVAPSSTLVTIGTSNDVNGASGTYVAYCFSEVAGYSKFGSYTGNGSSDGPFVFCGFKPRFVLFKNANDGGAGWHIFDSLRTEAGGGNPVDRALFPNNSNAEEAPSGSSSYVDYLSNGFKLRSGTGSVNGSSNTHIYAAFAETPTNNLFGGQANAR